MWIVVRDDVARDKLSALNTNSRRSVDCCTVKTKKYLYQSSKFKGRGFTPPFNSQDHIGTGPQYCHLWELSPQRRDSLR